MKRNVMVKLLGVFLVTILGSGKLWAQGNTAQISGMVTDRTGAVLPGVEVTATHDETGISRMTITNETGSYVLPNLPVGPYRLEVSLLGFRTFVRTGIVLQVNSTAVVSVILDVGQLTEAVEVQANASMVETRATGIGQVIDNAQIVELPLLGRQVTDLVVLAGAAVQTGVGAQSGRSFPGVARFSIAGSPSVGVSVTLDGASHNGMRQSSGMPLPFPDALQEFKVETSAVPAQYGFRGGGTINAVTKSGTNDLHGSAFWFARNGKFNARNFFAVASDGLKRNLFGGTVGGPIRQNRMFFFGGYQGTTTRTAPTDARSFVPTAAMMDGDFTAFASAACQGQPVTFGQPFVNNVLPRSAISPAALKLAQLLPTPIDQCGQVIVPRRQKNDNHMVVGKLDYQVNNNHTIFGRYLGAWNLESVPYTLETPANPLLTTDPGKDDLVQNITIGSTITFSANLVNSFRVGWNRETTEQVSPHFFGAKDLGVNIWQLKPDFIGVSVQTGGGFDIGGPLPAGARFRETGYQVADDLGLIAGKHQFNFGVNWMAFQTNNVSISWTPGRFTFNGSRTGLGLSDFMAGMPAILLQGNPSGIRVRTRPFALYAQDSWQVRPHLNLSLGLRWEPAIAQRFADKRANYFDWDLFLRGERSTQFLKAPAGIFYPGDAQFPKGGNDTTAVPDRWNQLAPRVGLVWDPFGNGRTVVRGAYGIFYELQDTEFFMTTGSGPPWAGQLNLTNFPGGFDDPYLGYPGGNPFPFVPGPDAPYPQAGVFTVASGKTDARTPYVHQWNFGIQWGIATDWLVSASYLGNKIVHLAAGEELNRAVFFPGVGDANGNCFVTERGRTLSLQVGAGRTCSTSANVQPRRLASLLDPTGALGGSVFGVITDWNDNGERTYNGMLLKLDKRVSHNFSTSFNYTWSHCISTPFDSFINSSVGNSLTDPSNLGIDRGNCGNKHIANATAVIQVPRFSEPVVQGIFGNWRVSGILRAISGNYLSATLSGDPALNGSNNNAQRPNQLLVDPYGNKCKDDLWANNPSCLWLDRAAFSSTLAPGTIGNVGAFTLLGPGQWTLDTGLARTFELGEGQQLEFRAEASNVLNHTNLGNPINRVGPTFGRITSSGDPRIMQFALKYIF